MQILYFGGETYANETCRHLSAASGISDLSASRNGKTIQQLSSSTDRNTVI
jgi:hypothetical protein